MDSTSGPEPPDRNEQEDAAKAIAITAPAVKQESPTSTVVPKAVKPKDESYEIGPYLLTEFEKHPIRSEKRKLWLRRRKTYWKSIAEPVTPEQRQQRRAENRHQQLVNENKRILQELRDPSKRKHENETSEVAATVKNTTEKTTKDLDPPAKRLRLKCAGGQTEKGAIMVSYDTPYFPPFTLDPENYPAWFGKPEMRSEKNTTRSKKEPDENEGKTITYPKSELESSNIGRKLMIKMGWTSGSGLGKKGNGRKEPIAMKYKATTFGLGYKGE